MKTLLSEKFALDNFEGPLDFLLHLIQKNEIDIYDISLHEITEQFTSKLSNCDPCLDDGAEFVGITSLLLWMKSKMLLPKHEQAGISEEEEIDPSFEIIHQLLDYCRFKEAARELSDREQKQNAFYPRGIDAIQDPKKTLGIAHLSLEDLAGIFKDILHKASNHRECILEETWKVSDKVKEIRYLLKQFQLAKFVDLFSFDKSRNELIVIFLAILELLKLGEGRVVRDTNLNEVMIITNTA